MKAGEVINRIKRNIGVPWRDSTYRDTYKSGGADTDVTGIATTAFLSTEVVEKALAAGLNMILPHEDTFWNDRDDVSVVGGSEILRPKLELLRRRNVVIFRLHDHMHAQRPDFTYVGSAREIGLDPANETAPGSHRFVIPETTLGALASEITRRSGARALRVVGDPSARVSRIQLGVGYATPPVNGPDVDVLISGEQQETDGLFDSPEYVMDAATLGVPKGWIMLGHVVSEEAGMLEMAQWVAGLVPELPVQFLRAGEPFWAPR